MKNKNTNHTIRKVMSLIHRVRPGHITLVFISRLIAAAQPFVGIIFSSKILDLIIQREEAPHIMKYAITLVCTVATLNLIEWGLRSIIGIIQG